MDVKKRQLAELVRAQDCVARKITATTQNIEKNVVLSQLESSHPISRFADVILDLMNEYIAQKKCLGCNRLFPYEMSRCLFCSPNQRFNWKLKGALTFVDWRTGSITFSDSQDTKIWAYAAQFAPVDPLFQYHNHPTNFQDADTIWIDKQTFLENGFDRVYTSVVIRSALIPCSEFYEFLKLSHKCHASNFIQELHMQPDVLH
jgi:hypothetical protein